MTLGGKHVLWLVPRIDSMCGGVLKMEEATVIPKVLGSPS